MRIHTFLLPALLAPAVLAQRVPEVEPNNTVAQAQVINPGTEVNANLVAAESDWYAFTITGGELRVCTNGTVDMRIRLYDATGTVPLAVNDDCRASLNSDLRINLQPGSYTLLVDGSSTSATGAYSLDVGLEGPFKPYTANELEPNENVAQAQLIVAGDQIRASLGPPVPVLSDLVPAPIIVLSDVVAASTTTVITATVPLTAGAYVPGFAVQMTSGTNIGLVRAISANTATTITTAAWPVANAPGDTYDVITANTTTLIQATTPLTPSAYVGGSYYVVFTSGANAGLERLISANTASTITVSAFPVAPLPGDSFDVRLADVDVYRLVLTAPRTGVWFLVQEGDAPWVSQNRYEIWDAAGNLLVPTATLGTNAGNSSVYNSRVSQIRVWPTGTYHFVVRRQATQPTTNNFIPYGNYRLEYYELPMNVLGVVPEVEPNNTFQTATPILPGQQGTGNITNSNGADPSDWWGPITLLNPSVLQFQTGQGAAPAIQDTTINLRAYDPITNTVGPPTAVTSGNILDPTSHARGTYIFTLTPNQYYLEVLSPGTGATQTGNYVLEIGLVLPAPYSPASYAIVAANGACGVAPFPTLVRQFTNEVPQVSQLFFRQLTNAPALAPVLILQGLSNTFAGATPLPFDLTPLGAPNCTVNVDPMAVVFYLADGAGIVDLALTVPPIVGLRGLPIYEQGAVLNPAANTLGLQMSNYGRMIIGDRSW